MSPVTLKMSNYKEMKRNDDRWCSDSFYTDDKGYKMHLEVHPAASIISKGTYLSCYLVLMKGPHDDSLSWPLTDKFEIKLLNQISDNQHYSVIMDYETSKQHGRKVTEGEEATGLSYYKFISNEDLYKITSTRQYLKDDCLFLQITKL